MKKDIPVIFVHKNNIKQDSSYVKYSVLQALKYNNNIVFISDLELDIQHPNLKKIDLEYTQKCKQLETDYVHMSTNGREFEMFCMQRHFITLNYMQKNGYKHAFYSDSDSLLFTNIENEYNNYFKNYDITLTLGGCGAACYVKSEALEQITDNILYTYGDKDSKDYRWFVKVYNTKREKSQPGGISDMNFLSNFANKNKETVFEMSNVVDKETWDTRIDKCYNNEYVIKNNIKDIKYVNKIPYCFNLQLNEDVKFKSLHFQGARKQLLETHYKLAMNE